VANPDLHLWSREQFIHTLLSFVLMDFER